MGKLYDGLEGGTIAELERVPEHGSNIKANESEVAWRIRLASRLVQPEISRQNNWTERCLHQWQEVYYLQIISCEKKLCLQIWVPDVKTVTDLQMPSGIFS